MSTIHRKGDGGFTLVEVAIIILTLAILSAILVPQLGRFNALARFIKVKEDLIVLCTAMKLFLDDTGESAFYVDGTANGSGVDTPVRVGNSQVIGLLIGDGDIPDSDGAGTDNWRLDTGGNFAETTDRGSATVTFLVDRFANQLIQNEPESDSTNRYRTPADMENNAESGDVAGGLIFDPNTGDGFNSLFAWRGPYINDRVYPDSWGNRYMANVFALHTPNQDGDDGYNSAVVCYSAGPDEQVDTDFNQPTGWLTGDDDQTVVLHAGGW